MIQSKFPSASNKDTVMIPFAVKCISEANSVIDIVAQESIAADTKLYTNGYLNENREYLKVHTRFTVEARWSTNVPATFVLTATTDLKGEFDTPYYKMYLHGYYTGNDGATHSSGSAYEIHATHDDVLVTKGTKFYIIYDPNNSSQTTESRVTLKDASGTVLLSHNLMSVSNNGMILYWF